MGLVSREAKAQWALTEPEPVDLPFTEGVAAVFEAGRLTDQSFSTQYQTRDALKASMARLAELGGPRGEVPWPLPDSTANAALDWLDSHKDTIAALRNPDNGPPDPFLKTGEEIRQDVKKRVEEARALASRAGLGASFVGGMGVGLTDPMNLALLPLGAGAAEGLLARVFTEAGIGAVSQMGVEIASAGAKERAGVADGLGASAMRVAETAVGAGALAGIFHGIGRVMDLRGKVELYRKGVAEGRINPTRATEAAADALQDHIDTVPPLATPAAEAAHLDATVAAVDVLTAATPEAQAMAQRRLAEKVAKVPVSQEDVRIASMSEAEWLASRPKADPGSDPTVRNVLAGTGIDLESTGTPGIDRIDAAPDQPVYVFRDEDGKIRGALHGFLDKDGMPELASVAVDPEFQRGGIGQKLIERARQDFPGANTSLVQETSGLTLAGARLRYRDAVNRVSDAAIAAEAASPRPPVVEPSIEAPAVLPSLADAERADFAALTEAAPDVAASIMDDAGNLRSGTARELMAESEQRATTFRDILSCIIKGGPTE